jgi:hypothetical protein
VKSSDRAYFSGCAALIGFAFGYALPSYARLPRAFYDPIARRWHFVAKMGPIPMGYVGLILWGIAGAIVAAALAGVITARLTREPSERSYALWGAWAMSAVAVVLGYFAWNNWP